MQIRRRSCGKQLLAAGYAEVEKCKVAAPGALCVTEIEMERAEHPSGSGATAERLEELKRLHDQHLITDDEYEAKRR